jgi:cbb3-type cytochrome oxidase subunit 1
VSRHTTIFIAAALCYLVIGMLLGLTMAFVPAWIYYIRPAHAHVNLLGWVSMFIFGVAYHVVPRFTGQPLHSERLADFHLIAANVGLVGMATSIALLGPGPVFGVFGTIEFLGNLAFVYNIGRTIWAAQKARGEAATMSRPTSGRTPLGMLPRDGHGRG